MLFIHSSLDEYLDCFHFVATVIMLVWTWLYKYLSKYLLSTLYNIYLGVKLLYQVAMLCLSVWGTTIPVPIAAAPFHIPMITAQGFQPLHILRHACYVYRQQLALIASSWCKRNKDNKQYYVTLTISNAVKYNCLLSLTQDPPVFHSIYKIVAS